MTCWTSARLLGIDVGFSEAAKSTGVAIYERGHLVTLTCIGSSPQHRATILRDHPAFDAIAIDGPIVVESDPPIVRACELMLSRGQFRRRCKPGLSHFGFGLTLRTAATRIASEMRLRSGPGPRRIVEAFPNAFLGVLLDDDDFRAMGQIARGKKSDTFYGRVAGHGIFETLLAHLEWHDDTLLKTLHDHAAATGRAAHDRRAALVCLLTAACALSGKAEHVGDAAGGYICLPPRALWASWARDEWDRIGLAYRYDDGE